MSTRGISAAISLVLIASVSACSAPTPKSVADKYAVNPANHPLAGAVVRIDATAKSCNTLSHGTGFAVAGGLIVSNAHVVAGASDIKAANPDGTIEFAPEVAYFDPVHDVAILRYSDVKLPLLHVGKPLKDNEPVTAYGYTAGKQLRAESSIKIKSFKWRASDIFGAPAGVQSIYKLKAHIRVCDSGGPLVDAQGDVRGVVFGKSNTETEVAYALGPEEILSAIEKANTGVSYENSRCLPKD